MRDNAIVTMEHVLEVIFRKSDGIISLTFGDLERPDQGHLLKNKETAISSVVASKAFKSCLLNVTYLFFLRYCDLEKRIKKLRT